MAMISVISDFNSSMPPGLSYSLAYLMHRYEDFLKEAPTLNLFLPS
jgi:hypothetical protein